MSSSSGSCLFQRSHHCLGRGKRTKGESFVFLFWQTSSSYVQLFGLNINTICVFQPVVRFTLTSDIIASTTPLDEIMYCDVDGKSKSDVITLDTFIRGKCGHLVSINIMLQICLIRLT